MGRIFQNIKHLSPQLPGILVIFVLIPFWRIFVHCESLRKKRKDFLIIGIFLYAGFWLPFLTAYLLADSKTTRKIEDVPDAEAVIVFGSRVHKDGAVTEMQRERLEAGIRIQREEKAGEIVASNADEATEVMARYLINRGVEPSTVERDPTAVTTRDTLLAEKEKHHGTRFVIVVSQSFHLPRILWYAQIIGINCIAFPAEGADVIDRSGTPWFSKVQIRTLRYHREALLMWLVVKDLFRKNLEN